VGAAGLPKLEELVMYGTKITDKGSVAFGRFPALKALDLSWEATDASGKEIAKVKTLKQLILRHGARISIEGEKAIQKALPGVTIKHS
jgi:hypothetical protein